MVKKIIVDNRVYTEMEGTNVCYIDGYHTVYDLVSNSVIETSFYRNHSSSHEYELNEWDAYWILTNIYNYDKDSLIEYGFPKPDIFETLEKEIKKDTREIIEVDKTEYYIE